MPEPSQSLQPGSFYRRLYRQFIDDVRSKWWDRLLAVAAIIVVNFRQAGLWSKVGPTLIVLALYVAYHMIRAPRILDDKREAELTQLRDALAVLKDTKAELEAAQAESGKVLRFELNQKEEYQRESWRLRDEVVSLKNQIAELTRESSQLKPVFQQELISKWRRMITEVERKYNRRETFEESFAEILERQPEYVSLYPYLSSETHDALRADKFYDGITIVTSAHHRKKFINPPDHLKAKLSEEIARIAKDWNLV